MVETEENPGVGLEVAPEVDPEADPEDVPEVAPEVGAVPRSNDDDDNYDWDG